MPFTLRITFAGLYAILDHDTRRAAAVLLPDCRTRRNDVLDEEHAQHEDGTFGRPHVGYLRFDHAALRPGARSPLPLDLPPQTEIVHRFDGEELLLPNVPNEADDAPPFVRSATDKQRINLPDLQDIATDAAPKAGLLDGTSSDGLLMRMLLRGGELQGRSIGKRWVFPPTLQKDHKAEVGGTYAGWVTWKREVPDADSLDVVLRPFGEDGGARETRLTLHPVDFGGTRIVNLKVANLCAVNPLEWIEFAPERAYQDVDFKWLYRLFTPTHAPTFADQLYGGELPCARLDLASINTEGDPGCFGLRKTTGFALPGVQA